MPTSLSPASPSHLAVQVLQRGGVVAYPTETVWGLAALPHFADELYRRKGREADKPLQVSCSAAAAPALAQPSAALDALSACWPGPLTVITAGRPEIVRGWGSGAALVAPQGQIGLRVPAHPAAQTLLTAAGPLATTSLNPSGQPPALTRAEAVAYALADFVWPDDEEAGAGVASTILQLPQGNSKTAHLLRPGGVSVARLRELLEPLGLRVAE